MGGPQSESLSQKVLDMLTRLAGSGGDGCGGGPAEVPVAEVSAALMVQTRKAHKQVCNALSELYAAGRVARVRQGVYTTVQQEPQQDLRSVMWRILRMRKRVTIDDLVEMAGVSRHYATEWLTMLVNRGVARKHYQGGAHQPRVWQLVADTVEMPADDRKAARLRELRKKQKQEALAAIEKARRAIDMADRELNEAAQKINNLEVEHE